MVSGIRRQFALREPRRERGENVFAALFVCAFVTIIPDQKSQKDRVATG
jgi:hypothetical protein